MHKTFKILHVIFLNPALIKFAHGKKETGGPYRGRDQRRERT
jgi:hypothetical protein